jgi:ribonuclease BN (tRNA processing enzyme)
MRGRGPVSSPGAGPVTVTFAGSGDAFGSGGRFQACIHLRGPDGAVAGVHAAASAADHPSGAPALALRLTLGATVIAYTGDTAWTSTLTEVAAGADLLIAEAYHRDKRVPFHLSLADLAAHRAELTSRRIVLTHMSADLLGRQDQAGFETAEDGLVLHVLP